MIKSHGWALSQIKTEKPKKATDLIQRPNPIILRVGYISDNLPTKILNRAPTIDAMPIIEPTRDIGTPRTLYK